MTERTHNLAAQMFGTPGAVVMPHGDSMPVPAAFALMELIPSLPPGSAFRAAPSYDVAATRNYLVGLVLEDPAMQWVMFLDSDMLPPVGLVRQLLGHEVPAVSALCYTRRLPYAPVVAPALEPDTGLHEVEAFGCAAALIRREVFDAMPSPWFQGTTVNGAREDIYFCERARELEFKLYCDTDIVIPHIGTVAIDADVAKRLQNDELVEELLAKGGQLF